MGEEEWSLKQSLTGLAVNDTLVVYDTSETNNRNKVKIILISDFYGATSGIPCDIGVYTAPSYEIHAKKTGENCVILAERDAGAKSFMSATDTVARAGAATAHPLQLYANAVSKVVIGIDGSITAEDVYADTCGPTNIDVYCSDDGKLGADPSSAMFKENIVDIGPDDCKWIYNLRVRKADYIGGPQGKICLIAEEAAGVKPEIVRCKLFDNSGKPLVRGDYEDIVEIEKIPMNTPTPVTLKKKKEDVKSNTVTTINIDETVTLKPITVNKTDLIIPMLQELKLKNNEIIALKEAVAALQAEVEKLKQ